jgi:glycosyltransferase involved in cell wall biosynthesis
MTDPFVSICIPTYNGERFLKECIDSCIDQTYPNYEIIVCDDGSSDGTVSMIEKYAATSNKIRLFKNEKNLGLVGNWNNCVEKARGKWIKFVFQDDYISRNCLQDFVAEIDPKTQLIVSKRNFILPGDASGDFKNYYSNVVRTLENTGGNTGNTFSSELISKIAVRNICMNFIGEPSLTFFKKTIVNELGPFRSDLKQICDLEFMLRIASRHGLKYVPEKLCAFRIHKDSTTSNNVENKFFELRYIEPLLFSYFLLFDPLYAPFRSHLNFFQMKKLKLYFELKVYNACRVNGRTGHRHWLFEGSGDSFKEIQLHKNGSLLVRLLALVKK